MLIKFFRNGQGGGAGPVDYLVEREVVAYDDNRNALRDSNGNALMFEREPLPEVLRGDPERMRHLIDACEHQWSYRAGVLSFTGEDAPTSEQQRTVMDAFEELAFAGLESDQRDILWVRHTHEDRVELHFVTPRMELATGRSLNIASPGYQKTYDALRDVLNKEHSWNDPQAPERAREVKSLIENVKRGEGREQIHDWIIDHIETGEITNRADMIDGLSEAGFDIPRAGKEYITVRDPASNERWRLKGDIFREDWTRADTADRALERAGQQPSRSGSRLDGFALKALRERLHEVTERRAQYNRERYGSAADREREIETRSQADLALDDNSQPDHNRGQLHIELDLRQHDDRQGAERQPLADGLTYQSNRHRNSSELGRETRQADRVSYWHRIRKVFADFGKELENDRERPIPDSTRTRVTELRRKIDGSIRTIGNAVQGIGSQIERHDQRASGRVGRLTEIADRVTGIIGYGLDRLRQQFGQERQPVDRVATGIDREPAINPASTRPDETRNLTHLNGTQITPSRSTGPSRI